MVALNKYFGYQMWTVLLEFSREGEAQFLNIWLCYTNIEFEKSTFFLIFANNPNEMVIEFERNQYLKEKWDLYLYWSWHQIYEIPVHKCW